MLLPRGIIQEKLMKKGLLKDKYQSMSAEEKRAYLKPKMEVLIGIMKEGE